MNSEFNSFDDNSSEDEENLNNIEGCELSGYELAREFAHYKSLFDLPTDENEIERSFDKFEKKSAPALEINKKLKPVKLGASQIKDTFVSDNYQSANYCVLEVAAYFIYLSQQEKDISPGIKEGLSAIKLECMLYLAQSFFYCRFNDALFKEIIYRTGYGPLIYVIREKYKNCANSAIICSSEEFDMLNNLILDNATLFCLDTIYSQYKNYSTTRLLEKIKKHKAWVKASATSRISYIKLADMKKAYWF